MSNGEVFSPVLALTGNGGCLNALNFGAGGGLTQLAEAAVSMEAMEDSPASISFIVC